MHLGKTIGITGYILGLYRDNGKENGNHKGHKLYLGYRVLGLYRDKGKENGNHEDCRVYIRLGGHTMRLIPAPLKETAVYKGYLLVSC